MTDKNTLPTTDQYREFTLLLGGEWHEIKSEGYYDGIRQVEQPKCSCGKSFLFLSELKDHIARNNPTPDQCKAFTLALGGEWHESIRSDSLHEYCSCGAVLLNKRALNFHKATLNPTYDSATILAKMREKFGEIEFNNFMWGLNEKRRDHDCVRIIYIMPLKYIFSPALLIGKATEFMKEKRK